MPLELGDVGGQLGVDLGLRRRRRLELAQRRQPREGLTGELAGGVGARGATGAAAAPGRLEADLEATETRWLELAETLE